MCIDQTFVVAGDSIFVYGETVQSNLDYIYKFDKLTFNSQL